MSAWWYEDAGRVVHSYRCDMPEVNFNRGAKAAACRLKVFSGASPDDALADNRTGDHDHECRLVGRPPAGYRDRLSGRLVVHRLERGRTSHMTSPGACGVHKEAATKNTEGLKGCTRRVCEAIYELGAAPPASNHIPSHTKTVTIERWRNYAYRRGVSGSGPSARSRESIPSVPLRPFERQV